MNKKSENKNLTIGVGNDHAGYKLKVYLKERLKKRNIKCIDVGCNSEESCDYPDYGHAVAELIENYKCDYGIVVCGSGNGINMAINKHKNVRSALCWNVEIADLARKHNDANVLALPARFIDKKKAFEIVKFFLNSNFEGGRHEKRVKKISIF